MSLEELIFFLEPAEGLGRHRHAEEADGVESQVRDELVIKLEAAAVVHPGQGVVSVLSENGPGAEQRGDLALPVPVHRHLMARIENALVHGVLDPEGLHDRAGYQIVDLQASARHLVDPGNVLFCHRVENALRAPGTLHLQAHRLGPRDIGEPQRRRARRARCNGRRFHKVPTGGFRSFLLLNGFLFSFSHSPTPSNEETRQRAFPK